MDKLKIMLQAMAIMPQRAHEHDAGLDLFAPYTVNLPPKSHVTIYTGVHALIEDGYVGLLTSKSGLMRYDGIISTGTIDAGYTGSINAILFNLSDHPKVIRRGDKITQLVILPCRTPQIELVESMPETERGENGFGSTGMSAERSDASQPQ